MSLGLVAFAPWICIPIVRPAASTSASSDWAPRNVGLIIMATGRALGSRALLPALFMSFAIAL
jgi:hypothetical protein